MKDFLLVLISFIVGFLLGITSPYREMYGSHEVSYDSIYDNIEFLDKEGDCIIRSNLRVIQGQERGRGLASPVGDFSPIVLILDENHLFYDGEIIKNPKGKCAKQIGVYRYKTIEDVYKTVPVVIIADIKNKNLKNRYYIYQ